MAVDLAAWRAEFAFVSVVASAASAVVTFGLAQASLGWASEPSWRDELEHCNSAAAAGPATYAVAEGCLVRLRTVVFGGRLAELVLAAGPYAEPSADSSADHSSALAEFAVFSVASLPSVVVSH